MSLSVLLIPAVTVYVVRARKLALEKILFNFYLNIFKFILFPEKRNIVSE